MAIDCHHFPALPDIVRDARLEAEFFTTHTKIVSYASGTSVHERRLRIEELWFRDRQLGHGAYGIVHLERCERGGRARLRAVKQIKKNIASGEPLDYARELEAIMKFSHQDYTHCFVRSDGWYESSDYVFITMEYLEHGDLQRHLTRPLPEHEAKLITSQILEGLKLMHENGFTHRDLKPGNIMVVTKGPGWFVKIADFGITKRRHQDATSLHTLQRGSLGFAAPEVLGLNSGQGSYTSAVDMWSLGAVVYIMLTTLTPFAPFEVFQYAAGQLDFPLESLKKLAVSTHGQDFIASLMRVNGPSRLSSADANTHPWMTKPSTVTLDTTGASHTTISTPSALWSTITDCSSEPSATIKVLATPTKEIPAKHTAPYDRSPSATHRGWSDMESPIRSRDPQPEASDLSIHDAKERCFRCLDDYTAHQNPKSAAHAQGLEQLLQLWAKHAGVDARMGMSLDDRLKDHPDLKTTFIGLLELIERRITEALSSPHDDADPGDIPTTEITVDDDYGDAEELLIKQKWECYRGNIWDTISAAVDMLIKLTAMVRKASVSVRNSSLAAHFHSQDDYFAGYAKILARIWLKDARRSLTDQLGHSVSVRRRYILYKMRHEEKISARSTEFVPAPAKTTPIPLSMREVAPKLELSKETPSPARPMRPVNPIFAGTTPSSTNLSELDKIRMRRLIRNTTAPSGIIEGSVSIEETGFAYMFPEPPSLGSMQRYAPCPYCSAPLSAKDLTKRAWRKHLYEDLQPDGFKADPQENKQAAAEFHDDGLEGSLDFDDVPQGHSNASDSEAIMDEEDSSFLPPDLGAGFAWELTSSNEETHGPDPILDSFRAWHENSQHSTEINSSAGAMRGAEVYPLPNDKYTVGWIATLPHEEIAAKAALDDFHGRRPSTKHPSDQNSYILGRISDHNVVIASLPGEIIGTTSATTTAMHMLASFPSIRIGLMVGIGAGSPKIEKDFNTNKNRVTRDIRLGDVVVSQPAGTHGGFKQYDFGKTIAGGNFQPSGFLNSPPRALLNAVSVLRQLHEAGESDMPIILNQMLENLNNATRSYEYPGLELDRLFEATYNHPQNEKTCEHCDEAKEITRPDRRTNNPRVHCGVIAFVNQVIKDPAQDKQKTEDLLASLLKQLSQGQPSLPESVRGLYDRHKKDRTRPSINELSSTVDSVVAAYSKIFIIVDALDECHTDQRTTEFLSRVFDLQRKSGAKFFATSRNVPNITREFEKRQSLAMEILATDQDVRESDSDDAGLDVNEVGSSARRMRKRLPRGSLLFQDPPQPRIDEVEEPNSSEDEYLTTQQFGMELPYSSCSWWYLKSVSGNIFWVRTQHNRMHHIPIVKRRSDLQEVVKTEISEAVEGMFLLVEMYMDSLIGMPTLRAFKPGLKDLKEASKS
ncbi:protein kinase [Cordyceps javanica]|nr:protein kinase [Cordyceps javanica]